MCDRAGGEACRGEAHQLVIASSPAASSPSADNAPLLLRILAQWNNSIWRRLRDNPLWIEQKIRAVPWRCITQGLNEYTWTCDIWRAQWALYSLLTHADNNNHCSQTWPETRVGEMPALCCSIKPCSNYYGTLSNGRKQPKCAHSVGLFRTSNTRQKQHNCLILDMFCRIVSNHVPLFVTWGYPCVFHWRQWHRQTNILSTSMYDVVETGSWGDGGAECFCISTPAAV